MKPLKLRFQAFASYAEAAGIDFEKLDSLFLIHGETGAGKTAVLDAMMYALYGESSGGERSELRCALPKAADTPTEVEFIFEVRGKKYKFTRSIEITPRSKQLRYKQDCFYFDEETEQFRAFFENPRQNDVQRKAEEITGLSAEQFRQVVILPQGRFERLLTSDSREKEAILSTLFSAEKYTRLSDKLHEKAEEERRVLDAEESALKAMLAGENADSAEKLSEEIESLSNHIEELSPQVEAAKKNSEKIRSGLTEAEFLSASFSELAAARERLSALDMRSGEIAEIKRLLSLHERSLKAGPEHAALSEARRMLNIGAEGFSRAEAVFSAAEKEFTLLSEKREEISALENKFAAKTEELALLNSLSEVYEKIGVTEEAVRKFSAEYSDCERSRVLAESSLKKTEKEISEAEEKRNKIMSEFSRQLPGLRAEKADLERGRESAEKAAFYESALKGIRENIEKLSARAKAAEKEKAAFEAEYDQLYNIYIANAAAELSSQLKEGSACPVCGSLSHPAPAKAHGDPVTVEQVKAAREKFEQAAKALSAINESIAIEQARIPAGEEHISGLRRVVEETGYTAAKLEEISRKCAEAERQNASLDELGKWINSLTSQKQAFEENMKTASERSENIRIKKTQAEAELAVIRERLVPDCPDRKAYVMKTSALKGEIEAFAEKKRAAEERFHNAEKRKIECMAALEQAQKEASAAEKRREEAEKAFSEKLAALGYSGEKQYEESLLPEETAARYSSQAEQYSMERHSAEEAAEKLSEKLKDKTPPDLEQIRAAADSAEKLYNELSRQEAVDQERLSRLKKLSGDYSKRYENYQTAREKSGKRLAFAKFMRGDKGISFTRYVLSIMLNLVVAEANRILSEIHGGMFRLCVKSELGSGSKQGLDLEVENTTLSAAVKYGVKNLSGGEKFLISLALSLGLSQVARSRAGGIQIEAMFIDEGFGSLDPASLREAVGILCGLSEGRNTIGIISHVEELQTVIPCCVKIKKSQEGGSVIEGRR